MTWMQLRNACMGAAVVFLFQPRTVIAQDVFELRELAPGVYAAEVLRNPAAYAFANSLVVIGDDEVLVVDTQQSLTAARSLIAEIAQLTSAPVRWVVNTHWHGDHVNGNQAYEEAYPGVRFIGHESLDEDLRVLGSERRLSELAELPATIEQRRRWLREGAGPDGTALTDADRKSVERSLALREAYMLDLARTEPTPPTIAFSERMSVTVGTYEVRLLYAGPAHTRGDLLVYLPSPGILAVGDLLEAGMPYFEDAYPMGWLRAVAQIDGLHPAIILPAHGRVTRDRVLIDEAEELLTAIIEHAAFNAAQSPGHEQRGRWTSMEKQWETRYGVSAPAFRAAMEVAIARAKLERVEQ